MTLGLGLRGGLKFNRNRDSTTCIIVYVCCGSNIILPLVHFDGFLFFIYSLSYKCITRIHKSKAKYYIVP